MLHTQLRNIIQLLHWLSLRTPNIRHFSDSNHCSSLFVQVFTPWKLGIHAFGFLSLLISSSCVGSIRNSLFFPRYSLYCFICSLHLNNIVLYLHSSSAPVSAFCGYKKFAKCFSGHLIKCPSVIWLLAHLVVSLYVRALLPFLRRIGVLS